MGKIETEDQETEKIDHTEMKITGIITEMKIIEIITEMKITEIITEIMIEMKEMIETIEIIEMIEIKEMKEMTEIEMIEMKGMIEMIGIEMIEEEKKDINKIEILDKIEETIIDLNLNGQKLFLLNLDRKTLILQLKLY